MYDWLTEDSAVQCALTLTHVPPMPAPCRLPVPSRATPRSIRTTLAPYPAARFANPEPALPPPMTMTSYAACMLSVRAPDDGVSHWCMTGGPIHNSMNNTTSFGKFMLFIVGTNTNELNALQESYPYCTGTQKSLHVKSARCRIDRSSKCECMHVDQIWMDQATTKRNKQTKSTRGHGLAHVHHKSL